MNQVEIIDKLRKKLKRDPVPFGHIAKVWLPDATMSEVHDALAAMAEAGEATVIYGRGWHKA